MSTDQQPTVDQMHATIDERGADLPPAVRAEMKSNVYHDDEGTARVRMMNNQGEVEESPFLHRGELHAIQRRRGIYTTRRTDDESKAAESTRSKANGPQRDTSSGKWIRDSLSPGDYIKLRREHSVDEFV